MNKDIKKKTKGLTSALWEATLNGRSARANELICSGVDVNWTRKTKYDTFTSLLHYATVKKDVERMRLLIKHGACCNARDRFDQTPLHWAIRMTNEDRPDIVEVLIDGGAKVDARDKELSTPLLLAAYKCQSVEMLITRGASINAIDRRGNTILHKAAEFDQLKLIKLLISHKINIDAEDHITRKTPLHLAVASCRTDSALLLIDNGADLNKKDAKGESALFKAVWKNPAMVPLLLNRGARVNEVDNESNTALHMACMFGDKDVAALLIKFGADINARNYEGKTALKMFLPFGRPSEAITKIIILEAIKLGVLGHPICEEYRQMAQFSERYTKFEQKCHEEVKRMRTEKIDLEDSVVSLFQICSMNEEKLAALVRNENIVTAFQTTDYLSTFTIYADNLKANFEKAKRRADFLISIEDCLADVLGDILPILVVKKIATYVKPIR